MFHINKAYNNTVNLDNRDTLAPFKSNHTVGAWIVHVRVYTEKRSLPCP